MVSVANRIFVRYVVPIGVVIASLTGVAIVPASATSQRQKMVAWSKPFLARLHAYETNAESLSSVISAAIQTGNVTRLLNVAGAIGNEAIAIGHMQNSPSAGVNVDVYKIAVAMQKVGRDLLEVDLAIRILPSDELSAVRTTTSGISKVTADINLATQALDTWASATP